MAKTSSEGTTTLGSEETNPLITENQLLEEENKNLKSRITELENTQTPDYSKQLVVLIGNSGENKESVKLSIESIRKYGRFEITYIVVVGKPLEGYNHVELDEPFNLINALKSAIAADVLSDEFIFIPKNSFVISPISLADIQIRKQNKQISGKTEAGSNTIKLLQSKKMLYINYSEPMPVCFEKEKMVELFEAFPEIQDMEVDLVSLYFNYFSDGVTGYPMDWKTDRFLLPIISENPAKEALAKYIPLKNFVSVEKWSKENHEMLSQKILNERENSNMV